MQSLLSGMVPMLQVAKIIGWSRTPGVLTGATKGSSRLNVALTCVVLLNATLIQFRFGNTDVLQSLMRKKTKKIKLETYSCNDPQNQSNLLTLNH